MSELVFVLNNAEWPVLLLNHDGTIRHGNPAALEAFGAAWQEGQPTLANIWSPDNSRAAKDLLAEWLQGAKMPGVWKFRAAGGTPQARLVSACKFEHDNEDFFLVQLLPAPPEPKPAPSPEPAEQLAIIQKQKLDCALQLARTMALDFNNALTSILGHASLVLGQMEATHPWRASLVEVEKSASRAAEIAADLAAFSRQEREPRTQAAGNLNQLLERVASLFRSSMPDKAQWSLQLSQKLYSTKFDEAKMQQVFTKILENSIQALNKEGRITLQTRNLDLTAPTQDRNTQLAAGSYVCVEILDNGCGIEPEVLPRIFEPFFTTKRSPQHRGLGLAWVYGVVTNHGGGVAVSSTPGNGTAVRVYLPADKKVILETSFNTENLKGTQTILMVDDEDLLLTMGQAILSSFGYKVLTANNGPRALEILGQDETPVDLLITDLVMPGISGRELIEQARQLQPELRVLSTSGYLFQGNNEDEEHYLQKPFTSNALLAKVKNVLAEPEG
jgi:two-component system, cell cycle sensor histidine kinase and response regulator CckA